LSLEARLDKHLPDCTHNYDPTRLKCPICLIAINGPNHVKVHKNTASLCWHIKTEHAQEVTQQFQDDLKLMLNYLIRAKNWGIFVENEMPAAIAATSSSSILFDGRAARKDVRIKLGKIAELLKLQSEFGLIFKEKPLKKFIKIVLGPVDKRTLKKIFCLCYKLFKKRQGTWCIRR